MDEHGNVGSTRWIFYVDLSNPQIQVDFPTTGQGVVGPNVMVQGFFSGVSQQAFNSLILKVSDGQTCPAYGATVVWFGNNSGYYYYNVPIPTGGWYWIDAVITCKSGLQKQDGVNVRVYSSTPPSITLFGSQPGTISNTLSGSYTYNDNASAVWITSATIFDYWNNLVATPTLSITPTGSNSGTFQTPVSLPDGYYTLVMTFDSSDGPSQTSTQSFKIDASPPQFYYVTPSSTPTLLADGSSRYLITNLYTSISAVLSIVDTGSGLAWVTASNQNNLPVSLSFSNGALTASGLTGGDYDILVMAVDAVGNSSVFNWVFTVDTGPFITGSTPPDGSMTQSLSFIMSYTSILPIAEFNVYLTDSLGTPWPVTVTNTTSSIFTVIPTNPVPDGTYRLGNQLVDIAGCMTYAGYAPTQTQDSTPPDITNLTPPDGSTADASELITISADITDALSSVATATMYVDGEFVGSYTTGNITAVMDFSQSYDFVHYVTVFADDYAGNSAVAEWMFFTINNTGPLGGNPNGGPNGGVPAGGNQPNFVGEPTNIGTMNLALMTFDENLEMSDDNGVNYAKPEWVARATDDCATTHNYPIAYVAGKNIKMKKVIVLDYVYHTEGTFTATITINGNLIGFASTSTFTVESDTASGRFKCILADLEFTPKLEDLKVQYSDQVNIRWEYTPNDGYGDPTGTPCYLGTTLHTFYVTHKAAIGHPCRYRTVYHIGCLYADDKIDETEILDMVWCPFSGRVVTHYDGTPSTGMTYWASNSESSNINPFTVEGLLEKSNGRCNAWALFHRDILRLQGVAIIKIGLEPKPNAINILPHLMAVKNCNISIDPISNPNGFTSPGGLPGQGTETPALKLFFNHAITVSSVNGKWYDPSYGNAFNNLMEWQTNSLDEVILKGPIPTIGFIRYNINNGLLTQSLVKTAGAE